MNTSISTKPFFLVCLLSLLLGAIRVDGGTIYVSPTGTGNGTKNDPANLQDALTTAAANGEDDIILLQQGTYRGNFLYDPGNVTEDVTLQGGWKDNFSRCVLDPANTILVGDGHGSVLKFNDWFTNTTGGNITVQGVTVRNGNSNRVGGGIYALTRPPGRIMLQKTIVENNTAASIGGGCALASLEKNRNISGSIIIENTIIRNNRATGYDDAQYGLQPGEGGGCIIKATGYFIMSNTLLYGNSAGTTGSYDGFGGGLRIELFNGKVYLVSNTISDNTVFLGKPDHNGTGGGLFIDTADEVWGPSNVMITNSIIWGNNAPASHAADIANVISNAGSAAGSGLKIAHSDFGDLKNYGSGTIVPILEDTLQANPLFSAPPARPFHLRAASPCIDQGDNQALFLPGKDLDGAGRIQDGDGDGNAVTDMGCYEVKKPFSWTMFIPAFTAGNKN